jgi:hypothetical protein
VVSTDGRKEERFQKVREEGDEQEVVQEEITFNQHLGVVTARPAQAGLAFLPELSARPERN